MTENVFITQVEGELERTMQHISENLQVEQERLKLELMHLKQEGILYVLHLHSEHFGWGQIMEADSVTELLYAAEKMGESNAINGL